MKYLTLLLLLPLLACGSSDTEDAAILSIATEDEDLSRLTLDDYPMIRYNEQFTITFSHRPKGLQVTGVLGWQLDGNVLHIERLKCSDGRATLYLDWSSGSRTYRFRCPD